jgi:para-nitrobenzyl esterase
MMPECVQLLRSNNINHYFGEEAISEDCLYLNLWAPATARAGANLPVVVWIYGGAFTGGSASMPLYSGEPLAKKGVLYVGLNYRLGVFGFLAHPEMTKESGRNASGNWGFLDQVAGLKWVQRNIAAFGGNPNNVTIIGQSAGSTSVNNLQASPIAKGLFHRVFGMSGSSVRGAGVALADSEQGGLALQNALKVTSLAEMRTFSNDKVMAAIAASPIRMGPNVDGYFLPKSVQALFDAGEQSDVPVMAGATANDNGTAVAIRRATTLADYRTTAATMFGPAADEFLKLFPAASDAEARAQAEMVGRASGTGMAGRNWASAQTKTGRAPAYVFLFSRTQPYTPGVVFADHDPATAGSYHAADIPYWFQTQDSFNLFRTTRSWTPLDRDLADKMSDIVIAYAKTGVPGTAAVKVPKFDRVNEEMIELGDVIRVVKVNTAGMDFLASHAGAGGGRGGRGTGR